jgi:hypothetical protein
MRSTDSLRHQRKFGPAFYRPAAGQEGTQEPRKPLSRPLRARLACLNQEILRAPQQLNHRVHAVVEGLTINGRHFPT